MAYQNDTKDTAGDATTGYSYLDKHQVSSIWRLAVGRAADETGNLIALAEVGQLDHPAEIANLVQLSIHRAARVLTPISRRLPACKLVVDVAAVFAILLSLRYHLQPRDLLLVAVVGMWAACRFALLWVQATAKAAAEIDLALNELCLAVTQLQAAEEGYLAQSAQDALLTVYTAVAFYLFRTLNFVNSHKRVLLHQRAWATLATQSTSVLWQHRQMVAAAQAQCLRSKFTQNRLELVQQKQFYSNVPSPLGSQLYCRDNALQAVARALRPGQVGTDKLRSCVLFGIGGVGKTHIAQQHAAQHRQDYSAIFWANATSVKTLEQSLSEVAQLIDTEVRGTGSAVSKVNHWLNNTDQSWLMIFDGADDLDILEHFWPGTGRGSILITTRDHTGAQARGLDLVYNVRLLRPTESVKFLLCSVGICDPSPEDRELAHEIASERCHLPLALKQASGLIVQRQLSMRDFLHAFRFRSDAEEIEKLTTCAGGSRSVASLWQDTFCRISGKPLLLLNVLAFMAGKGTKEEALCQGAILLRQAHPQMGRKAWKLMIFMNDRMEMSGAQEVLLKWGLISRDPAAGVLSMIPAVRQAAVFRLKQEERQYFFFIAREIERLTLDLGEDDKVDGAPRESCGYVAKQHPVASKPIMLHTAARGDLATAEDGIACQVKSTAGPPHVRTLSEFVAFLTTQQSRGGCGRVVRPALMRGDQAEGCNADMLARPLRKRTLAEFVEYIANHPPGAGKPTVRPAAALAYQAKAAEAMAYKLDVPSRTPQDPPKPGRNA